MAKPKVSFQVEPEDETAIDRVTALVGKALPGMRSQAKSLTMRAALRIGLAELARDPERAPKVEPPAIDEDEPKSRKRG